jgi:hypothetical protein
MNTTELQKLVEETCSAFPGMQELVEKHPSVVATWGKTLHAIALQDAMAVLNRWIAGTLENPPVGFRREVFALDIKAVVERVHSDIARKRLNHEVIDRADRRKNYRSAVTVLIGPVFEKFLAYNEEVINGTMSHDERELKIKNEIQALFPGVEVVE